MLSRGCLVCMSRWKHGEIMNTHVDLSICKYAAVSQASLHFLVMLSNCDLGRRWAESVSKMKHGGLENQWKWWLGGAAEIEQLNWLDCRVCKIKLFQWFVCMYVCMYVGFVKIKVRKSEWLSMLSNALKGLRSSSIGIGDVSLGYTWCIHISPFENCKDGFIFCKKRIPFLVAL